MVLAIAVVGCGKKGGAGTKEVEGGAWKFVAFVDSPRNGVALVERGTKAAFVKPDGTLSPTITVSSDDLIAKGNGDAVVLADGKSIHAVDAMAGREFWSHPVAVSAGSIGASTVAVATGNKSLVFGLTGGQGLYEGSLAKRVVRAGDGFAFASDDEVWFVEESGKERWRKKVERLEKAAFLELPGSLLVVRPEHNYVELTLADGSSKAGTCDPPPNAADEAERGHATALPCVGGMNMGPDDSVVEIAGSKEVGDYNLLSKPAKRGDRTVNVIARDAVGRVRWSVPWPVQSMSVTERARIASDAKLVAFVVGSAGDARHLLVFDDSDGRFLFDHPLAAHERVAGLAESCWLIVGDKAVRCIEARSGAGIWSVPAFGAKVEAWPMRGGEALIADGNPLALSRIAKDGKRSWQTELPDTELEISSRADMRGSLMHDAEIGRASVLFSDVMAVIPSKTAVVVLDLSTGKTVQVH